VPQDKTAWSRSGVEPTRIDLQKLCEEFAVESAGSDSKNKEKSDLHNGKITTLLEINRANHIGETGFYSIFRYQSSIRSNLPLSKLLFLFFFFSCHFSIFHERRISAILLASLKLPNSEIKQAILSLEDDFLSIETLKALRLFSPSPEEVS
jgi:hypothetical protein